MTVEFSALVGTAFLAAAQQSSELESVMLSEDKLYVVLAVVLVIWAGILIMLARNDRKIAALEERLDVESETNSDKN